MINKAKFKVLILGVFVLFFTKIHAQDLHYSQFYNSPQNLNPALTGVFKGDHRFTVSWRDQWRFVPVPWTTFSGSYDTKLYLFNEDHHFLGGGLSINHDRQGDSPLTLTSVNLNGAYHRILSARHILSGGITLGFASRGFNSQTLTWDKQWNGDAFDPNLPTGEGFDDFERVNFFETGLGLNYRYQVDSRTFADAGIGLLHLFKPSTSFIGGSSLADLPQRATFSLVGQAQVIDVLDIQLHVLHQLQGEYDETIFGALGKIYISQQKGNEVQLHAGLGYRTAGSLFPTFGLQYNNIYASFSYDADNTNFNKINNIKRGGPELHFRYYIANVQPLKQVKNCPIY
ncbi:MAG: PorP/SprF family type IX secretion system membrane protein [Chitinophagales bacterium]|nr:PorP/SprF family type IX secretion system membrane protein [Chitinophagales bacterium]